MERIERIRRVETSKGEVCAEAGPGSGVPRNKEGQDPGWFSSRHSEKRS